MEGLEPVSYIPAAALGRAASRARREERGVLEDEYASDEPRRAAPRIGPAPGQPVGCGGTGSQAGGPHEEAAEGAGIAADEPAGVGRGDLFGVQHAAIRPGHPECLHPPADQRRAPGGEEVGPGEAEGQADQTEDAHSEKKVSGTFCA